MLFYTIVDCLNSDSMNKAKINILGSHENIGGKSIESSQIFILYISFPYICILYLS